MRRSRFCLAMSLILAAQNTVQGLLYPSPIVSPRAHYCSSATFEEVLPLDSRRGNLVSTVRNPLCQCGWTICACVSHRQRILISEVFRNILFAQCQLENFVILPSGRAPPLLFRLHVWAKCKVIDSRKPKKIVRLLTHSFPSIDVLHK
jgi:hypothetical protein